MQKVLKPHPAVIEYDRLENTYSRWVREMTTREQLDWALSYYKMRTNNLAKIYGLDEDDLITQWIKWQRELRAQAIR